MKKSSFTEQQIAYGQQQQELRTPVNEICRKLGVAQAMSFVCRKRYSGTWPARIVLYEAARDENSKLKKLVANLCLDMAMLQHVVRRKSEARTQARTD